MLRAILEWKPVLPGDIHSPVLWLMGSENKGAMASLNELQESLPKSVQIHVIEGLTHEQECTEIDEVLPILLEFTQAVWNGQTAN